MTCRNSIICDYSDDFVLISAVQIEFPDDHWLPEHMLPDLERLLPVREHIMLTDDMEEVDLCQVDFESQQRRNHSAEAYHEDDEEERRQTGVQCQTQ